MTIKTDANAKYDALVKALDCIMNLPDLKVAFGAPAGGSPPAVANGAGATSRPAV